MSDLLESLKGRGKKDKKDAASAGHSDQQVRWPPPPPYYLLRCLISGRVLLQDAAKGKTKEDLRRSRRSLQVASEVLDDGRRYFGWAAEWALIEGQRWATVDSGAPWYPSLPTLLCTSSRASLRGVRRMPRTGGGDWEHRLPSA